MAGNTISKLKELLDQAKSLVDDQGFHSKDHRWNSALYRFAHFWVLVARSFVRNRGLVHASSLAYTTLLALIPMLAVAFSVATSLIAKEGEEGQQQIEDLINRMVVYLAPMLDLDPNEATKDGQVDYSQIKLVTIQSGYGGWAVPLFDAPASNREEVARKISEFINNIQTGAIGITGAVGFIVFAILLLRAIESTFNDVWGVRQGRGWIAAFAQYWAGLTLGPILLLSALTINSSVQFRTSVAWLQALPWIGNLSMFVLACVLASIACALLYKMMPNTYVHVSAACVGGLVGGTLLQLNSKLSALYFANVASASKIYGSLSAVPIFLLGIYISWIILLFGAQVAYAFQNYESYMQEKMADEVHQSGREFLALRIMTLVAGRYAGEHTRLSSRQISKDLAVPSALAVKVLDQLVRCEMLVETADKESAYVPTRPPDQMTAQDVLQAMRAGSGRGLVTREDEQREGVRDAFKRIQEAESQPASSMTLAELARSSESDADEKTAKISNAAG